MIRSLCYQIFDFMKFMNLFNAFIAYMLLLHQDLPRSTI